MNTQRKTEFSYAFQQTIPVMLRYAVVSLCTILLRAFPFLIFWGKREVPALVKYLGDVLPASISGERIFCSVSGQEQCAI